MNEPQMQEVFRRIGWKLMNLRQGKRLTQTELGEKIGLSKYQVSRLEKGFGDTTLRNINLACHFFEFSMEELFQKEEKVRIDIALREEIFEKHPNGLHTTTYTKSFDSIAKVRIQELPINNSKSIRIESGSRYEVFAIDGKPTVQSYNDTITMKPGKMVSMKGQGYAKLLNFYEEPARVLIFIY